MVLFLGKVFGHVAVLVFLAAATPTCFVTPPLGQHFGLGALRAVEDLEHKSPAIWLEKVDKVENRSTVPELIPKCKSQGAPNVRWNARHVRKKLRHLVKPESRRNTELHRGKMIDKSL